MDNHYLGSIAKYTLCVCIYVKHMNALHIIFLTRIIFKYFAFSISSNFIMTSATCYKDSSGKGK